MYTERQLPSRLLQGDERRRTYFCHFDSEHYVICYWLRYHPLAY
jgi:hypothetical protein